MVARLAVDADDVGDAEVDVGSQPAVELDFAVAGLLPQLPVGEVQEPQRHRLLEFVDPITDRDENGDVRLGQRRGVHRLGHHAGGRPAASSSRAAAICSRPHRVGS
jgi:hypothetical protein